MQYVLPCLVNEPQGIHAPRAVENIHLVSVEFYGRSVPGDRLILNEFPKSKPAILPVSSPESPEQTLRLSHGPLLNSPLYARPAQRGRQKLSPIKGRKRRKRSICHQAHGLQCLVGPGPLERKRRIHQRLRQCRDRKNLPPSRRSVSFAVRSEEVSCTRVSLGKVVGNSPKGCRNPSRQIDEPIVGRDWMRATIRNKRANVVTLEVSAAATDRWLKADVVKMGPTFVRRDRPALAADRWLKTEVWNMSANFVTLEVSVAPANRWLKASVGNMSPKVATLDVSTRALDRWLMALPGSNISLLSAGW